MLGGCVPNLWHASAFSPERPVLSTVGGLLGIWAWRTGSRADRPAPHARPSTNGIVSVVRGIQPRAATPLADPHAVRAATPSRSHHESPRRDRSWAGATSFAARRERRRAVHARRDAPRVRAARAHRALHAPGARLRLRRARAALRRADHADPPRQAPRGVNNLQQGAVAGRSEVAG